MKSIEQLVNAIRELRFAIDRLPGEELADAPPATRQALVTQARALETDLEALLLTLGESELAELQ
jgi:hypothetical protein